MTGPDCSESLAECLAAYLGSLPLPGRQLTSADVEKGQRGKQRVVDAGGAAVPLLLDGIAQPDFQVKDVCFDLILNIGTPAKDALRRELGRRGPVLDIWIEVMRARLGDAAALAGLLPYLDHALPYVRHLSALALAFQAIASQTAAPPQIHPVLLDALDSTQTIEGTPFTIAGSALGCLTALSGEDFLATRTQVQFYNFEHFVFPPPLHPFPFVADHFTGLADRAKQDVRERVRTWIAGHRCADS